MLLRMASLVYGVPEMSFGSPADGTRKRYGNVSDEDLKGVTRAFVGNELCTYKHMMCICVHLHLHVHIHIHMQTQSNTYTVADTETETETGRQTHAHVILTA